MPLSSSTSNPLAILPLPAEDTEQTFALFPNLPPELRLKIWRNALPLFARIVEIRTMRSPTHGWKLSPSAPCTLLHVNQETRNEFLEYYVPTLNGQAPVVRNGNHPMHPTNDILHFEYVTLFPVFSVLNNISARLKSEIRTLAGNCYFWQCMRAEQAFHKHDHDLALFSNLEHLVWAVSDHESVTLQFGLFRHFFRINFVRVWANRGALPTFGPYRHLTNGFEEITE